jgi:hypothetical protein
MPTEPFDRGDGSMGEADGAGGGGGDEYAWLREQLQAAARLAEAGGGSEGQDEDWQDPTGGALTAILVRYLQPR